MNTFAPQEMSTWKKNKWHIKGEDRKWCRHRKERLEVLSKFFERREEREFLYKDSTKCVNGENSTCHSLNIQYTHCTSHPRHFIFVDSTLTRVQSNKRLERKTEPEVMMTLFECDQVMRGWSHWTSGSEDSSFKKDSACLPCLRETQATCHVITFVAQQSCRQRMLHTSKTREELLFTQTRAIV